MELIKLYFKFNLIGFVFFVSSYGSIQLNESVLQFKYPKFSDNGYIEWVLEGNSANNNDSNIFIEGLKLRIYSGDKSVRNLSYLTGEDCEFNTNTQVASSENSILINGTGFELSGNVWFYDLSKEIIKINSDAVVRFSQNVDSVFSGIQSSGETEIVSDEMELVIEPTRYLFTFRGNCKLNSDSHSLVSKVLKLELLNKSNKINFSIPSGELSGMKLIQAIGSVEFNGIGQNMKSENLTIHPRMNKAIFEGGASIDYDHVTLRGDTIDLIQDRVEVVSYEDKLSSFINNSTLNKDLSENYGYKTSIQSKKISIQKKNKGYDYYFSDNVFMDSNLHKIHSQWLYVETEKTASAKENHAEQNIVLTEAKESILLENANYKLGCNYLKYFPKDSRLELESNVTYISEFSNLKSDTLTIEEDELFAKSVKNPVEVILPNSNDFNFELTNNKETEIKDKTVETVIYSDYLNIKRNNLNDYKCIFNDNIKLTQNDFLLNSDKLVMNWAKEGHINSEFKIENVYAEGSVVMKQKGYHASADNLEISPNEKMFYLIGEANFKDMNGSIYGDRIEFDRKMKQTKVIGATNGERARIQLDLFGNNEENLEDLKK